MFKYRNTLIAFVGMVLAIAVGVNVAQSQSALVSLQSRVHIAINSSFLSPLNELFGEVSIGRKSFVAGNTVLRADPGTRICIGNATNLQDNIRFVALQNLPAPTSPCGTKSSSTQDRVSIAHQAVIENSNIGNFTFVGFRSRIINSTLPL